MSSIPITSDDLKQYDAFIKQYIQQEINKAVASVQNYNVQDTLTVYDGLAYTPPTASIMTLEHTPAVMSIQPETITVQEDIQEDYIIYDRVITPNANINYRNIVVTGDDRSNRVFFNMWYTFDDRELENKTISIIWINANNEKGESLAVDKEIKDNNRLVFAWNVPAQATYKEGTIQYAIRITGPDYAWHTLPSTIECVKGLMSGDFNSLQDAELSPGWVDYIEGKYAVGVQSLTISEYESLTEKSTETLYLVTNADGTVTQYLGTTVISNSSSSSGTEGNAKIVAMTATEYAALDNPDADTLYVITG